MLKVDIIFNANLSTNGWEESFYWNKNLGDAGIKDAIRAIVNKRVPLLSSWNYVAGIRLRDLAVRGSTDLVSLPNPLLARVAPVNDQSVQDVHTGWEYSLRGSTVGTASTPGYYRRNYVIRGLPPSAYVGSPSDGFNQTDAFFGLSETWLKTMVANFLIRARDKKVAKTMLTGAVPDTQGRGVLFSSGAAVHGLQPGMPVHLYSAKYGWKKTCGDWIVVDTPDNFHFVLGCPVGDGTFLRGAYVRRINYVYAAITDYQSTRPLSRKTGKPFFGTRGRVGKRKARVL